MSIDLDALHVLVQAHEVTNLPVHSDRALFAELAVGLLMGNYGRKKAHDGEPSNNWLGTAHLHQTPLEGASELVWALNHACSPEELSTDDPGKLAWALVEHDLVPSNGHSTSYWRGYKQGLKTVFERYQKNFGMPWGWNGNTFSPPLRAPKVWSHEDAFDLIESVFPGKFETKTIMGMLLWAYVGANYGELESGRQTHNWGSIGQKVAPGQPVPAGHVLNEFGEFAVKVYPDLRDGLRAFVQRVFEFPEVHSGDLGLLAERMIKANAFGDMLPLDHQSWGSTVANLRRATEKISQATSIPAWKLKHAPEVVHEKVVAQVKEETTPTPTRKFPWHWLMLTAPVVGAGALFYMHRKKKNAELEEAKKKKELEEQKAKLLQLNDLSQEDLYALHHALAASESP